VDCSKCLYILKWRELSGLDNSGMQCRPIKGITVYLSDIGEHIQVVFSRYKRNKEDFSGYCGGIQLIEYMKRCLLIHYRSVKYI